MKITKIEKKKRLYLVEIDNSDKLYVTEDTIVRFMLTKGLTLDDKMLKNIQTFAQFSHGKNLALYYISFKQRTTAEVRLYLMDHDIKSDIIEDVLKNLKEDKWLDDGKYVENFISQNLSSDDKGPYVIKQKLLQKGIPAQLIDQEIEKQDFSEVAEKAANKLLKKYQTKLPARTLKDKIIQSLSNKGFSYAEAKTAFESLKIESDDENEQDLLHKELDKTYRKYSKKYEGYDLKQRLIQALARKGFGFDDINSALRDYL